MGSFWPQWAIVFVIVVAAVVLYSNWRESVSPAGVVQRCADAIKQDDWKTVYHLIAWGEGSTQKVDEGLFVSIASNYSRAFVLDDFVVGKARVTGDTAVVPFSARLKVSQLLRTGTQTSTGDIHCRLVKGEWKIVPDSSGLLSFTRPN